MNKNIQPERQQVKRPERPTTYTIEVGAFGSRESASNFAEWLNEYAINKNLKIEIKENRL